MSWRWHCPSCGTANQDAGERPDKPSAIGGVLLALIEATGTRREDITVRIRPSVVTCAFCAETFVAHAGNSDSMVLTVG
jgi:hypothetical protein